MANNTLGAKELMLADRAPFPHLTAWRRIVSGVGLLGRPTLLAAILKPPYSSTRHLPGRLSLSAALKAMSSAPREPQGAAPAAADPLRDSWLRYIAFTSARDCVGRPAAAALPPLDLCCALRDVPAFRRPPP